jgi:hypothetical protein
MTRFNGVQHVLLARICGVGVFAHVRRNRNGFGWFALAVLLSPLISFLLLLILHPGVPVDPAVYQIDESELKTTHIVLIFAPAALAIVAVIIACDRRHSLRHNNHLQIGAN